MCGRLDSYLISFSHIKSAKDKNRWSSVSYYRCPGKPLLLLSVLSHIASGRILRNFISPSADLVDTYNALYGLYSHGSSPTNLTVPFYELGKTTFWDLCPKSEQKQSRNQKFTTIDQLKEFYFGAKFSEDLFMLLQMQHSRKKFVDTLIKSHFSPEFKNSIKDFADIH